MHVTFLFLASLLLLTLLTAHSFLCRGRYASFSFFLFAAGWAIAKELIPSRAPYGFTHTGVQLYLSKCIVVMGWMITFYLGWCVAEHILGCFRADRRGVFPTLLLSCLVVGSIANFMETTGPGVQWWRWDIRNPDPRCTALFVGGCSIRVIEAWVYFHLHFLCSYFFIFYAPPIRSALRYVFLLFPFTAIWTIAWKNSSVEFVMALAFLAAFAVFRHPDEKIQWRGCRRPGRPLPAVIRYIPLWVYTGMLATVVFFDIVVAKDPFLVVSALPAAYLILLSTRISRKIVFLSLLPLMILLGVKIVPVFFTVLFVLMLQ